MNLKAKTTEELFDLVEEFEEKESEETDGYVYDVISIYQSLYRKIKLDKENEYRTSLPYIQEKLISYLIRYGTYLKTQYKKDDRTAEDTLKKALKYDREIPIAHYRLGFLNYKKRNYTNALNHFQQAVNYHETYGNRHYRLTKQQQYNAQLYLVNRALYIAEQAQVVLEELGNEVTTEQVLDIDKSPLYEVIQRNESYLTENAFTVVKSETSFNCSKERCNEIAFEEEVPDHIILYFSDQENYVSFNGKGSGLNINEAEMLRYFLLRTDEQNPATKHAFSEIISGNERSGDILDNTYIQRVRRLKKKMADKEMPSLIDSKSANGKTANFYNYKFPYIVMYRQDISFMLDE